MKYPCKDLYCRLQAFDLFRLSYGIEAKPEDLPVEWEWAQKVAHFESLLEENGVI